MFVHHASAPFGGLPVLPGMGPPGPLPPPGSLDTEALAQLRPGSVEIKVTRGWIALGQKVCLHVISRAIIAARSGSAIVLLTRIDEV